MTGVVLDLDAGALREMHWHPHANEWLYLIRGKVRMGLFGSHGRYREEDFGQGDAGYVPQGFGHYVKNVGDSSARLLIVFDKGEYEEISLSGWLAANPVKLTADNFKIADGLVERMPDQRVYVAPKEGMHKAGKGYE